MKKNTVPTGVEKMTDSELSRVLGRYQRTESLALLLGILLVAAGCISALLLHNVLLLAVLVFGGVGLILLLGLPAQKKKKALIRQQLGSFFRTELTRVFGPEPTAPELPIDEAFLKSAQLLAIPWSESTITEFHEGAYQGTRFSAANAELQRTVEEKSGPNHDNWMTRTETLFRGIIVRCQNLCGGMPDLTIRDQFQERKKDDLTDPAAFGKHFAAFTADGQEADELVTPQLQELVQKLEDYAGDGKVSSLILKGGSVTLALHTAYVFAAIPDALDARDVDGMRKWFTVSLKGMCRVLDILREGLAPTDGER